MFGFDRKVKVPTCHWQTHYYFDVYNDNGELLDNWNWMPDVRDIPIPHKGEIIKLYYRGKAEDYIVNCLIFPMKFYVEDVKYLLKENGNMFVTITGTNRKDKKYNAE